DTSNPDIYTLSLHDALPISPLGYSVLMVVPPEYTNGKVILGFGVAPKPDFWLAEGAPNEPRLHVAFRADSRSQVVTFIEQRWQRSEEHTSELQSRRDLVCRL